MSIKFYGLEELGTTNRADNLCWHRLTIQQSERRGPLNYRTDSTVGMLHYMRVASRVDEYFQLLRRCRNRQ